MECYRFEEGLVPLTGDIPGEWERLLLLAKPAELAELRLPEGVTPPEVPENPHESQFCWLRAERMGIFAQIRVPALGKRAGGRFAFSWQGSSLLVLDPEGLVSACVKEIRTMRPHNADGADNFLADLFITLLKDDLGGLLQLETRLSNLEQAVLTDQSGRFLRQMSVIRKELNRANRFYAQLGDFASSLQEYAGDLFDTFSAQRFDAFLRKADALREETRMLREYASQISSEYQAQVDIQQNRVMKLLTIVTTIFLPLSLLVGWYGMNFQGMPELSWTYGYPAVIAVSVLLAVGLIVYFKRKHWF